ncbi:MAG TPA: tungsten ABC transporter substrate-binding protein [Polynucleobacter sp.]|nr:tungsten ABC transporter substrate-binding protein [Polynucleobacter sp.]
MKQMIHKLILATVVALAIPTSQIDAQENSIVMSSTTSTEQSGLFNCILPIFKMKTGIDVKVVAVGTGQALHIGKYGDADVVFVHDKPAAEKFVDEGFSTKRYEMMYNDFVLIGPKSDPAKISGAKDIQVVLQKIAAAQAPFVSRADKSSTHAAELRYWKGAEISIAPGTPWYKEADSGMGPALNTVSAMNGYILADRGTWLSFKNRGDLTILVQGDPTLFNQYGVMLVNPAKFPHVKKAQGQEFIDWIISQNGQNVIASYKIEGEQLFFPNAKYDGTQ